MTVAYFRMIGKYFEINDAILLKRQFLNRLNHFIESLLEILLSSFSKLNFDVVLQCDGCLVIVLEMSNVVEVDQIGFMSSKKIVTRKAILDFFQDFCQHNFFAQGGDYFSVSAMCNATKDLLPPEEFDTSGSLDCDFG